MARRISKWGKNVGDLELDNSVVVVFTELPSGSRETRRAMLGMERESEGISSAWRWRGLLPERVLGCEHPLSIS